MREYIEAVASAITEILSNPPAKGALAGTIIALLRIMYDDREPNTVRRLLEAALCGSIAWVTAYVLPAIGLSADTSVFIGGMVGLLGADKIRSLANTFARRKASGRDEQARPPQSNTGSYEGEE